MNVAYLNGSKHKTIYLSMQLPSKESVLVDILNPAVCAAWKPVGLCMSHCSVIKSIERGGAIVCYTTKGDYGTPY